MGEGNLKRRFITYYTPPPTEMRLIKLKVAFS